MQATGSAGTWYAPSVDLLHILTARYAPGLVCVIVLLLLCKILFRRGNCVRISTPNTGAQSGKDPDSIHSKSSLWKLQARGGLLEAVLYHMSDCLMQTEREERNDSTFCKPLQAPLQAPASPCKPLQLLVYLSEL